METLSRVGRFTTCSFFPFQTNHSLLFPTLAPIHPPPAISARISSVSVSRASPPPVSEVAEEDVLQMFFKKREVNGDFISKASDILCQREVMKFVDAETGTLADTSKQSDESSSLWVKWVSEYLNKRGIREVHQLPVCSPGMASVDVLHDLYGYGMIYNSGLLRRTLVMESEYEGGFLKLTRTHEWVLGDNSAPINKKAIAKALRDDSERRKKMNLLQYEALKRELLLLSVGIGTACTGYCLIVFSVQAAISYATGVLFSCLYLQLLYQQVDNLSKQTVPQIFMQKKSKKIGIRNEDLKDALERSIMGSSMALSSPRLVIPAAIYGLWVLSHQHFASDFFEFQLVPAMLGMFAYKAAALVQVYRDNKDLQFIFPENNESSD